MNQTDVSTDSKKQFLLILDFTDWNKKYPRTNFGAHITPCAVNIDDPSYSSAGKSKACTFIGMEDFLNELKKDPSKLDEYLSDPAKLPPVIRDVILPQLNEFQKSLTEGQYAKLVIVTGGHGSIGDTNIYSNNGRRYCAAENIAQINAALMLIAHYKKIPFERKNFIAESCKNLAQLIDIFKSIRLEPDSQITHQRNMRQNKEYRKKHTIRRRFSIPDIHRRYNESFAGVVTTRTYQILQCIDKELNGFSQVEGSRTLKWRSNHQPTTYKAQSSGWREKIEVIYPSAIQMQNRRFSCLPNYTFIIDAIQGGKNNRGR